MKKILIVVVCAVTSFFFAYKAQATAVFSLTDLGALSGTYSTAHGINDQGQVAGRSDGLSFVWDTANGMRDIGGLGGTWNIAHDINNSNQVVGRSGSNAFIWDNISGMTNIGTLGGSYSEAYAINNSGMVTGDSFINNEGWNHAFVWDSANGIRDIGTLAGYHSNVGGINDTGQVVGWSNYISSRPHAFLWDETTGMQDLGALPGHDYSIARDINNYGQVIGNSSLLGVEDVGFIWDETNGMINLGDINVRAINDFAQVVGTYKVPSPAPKTGAPTVDHAMIWEHGEITDLNELIDSSLGWELKIAYDINESGQIVGYGSYNGGNDHAFLLTPDQQPGPVPEPATILLFGTGLAGIVGSGIRRKKV